MDNKKKSPFDIARETLGNFLRPQTGTLATQGRQAIQNIARTPLPKQLDPFVQNVQTAERTLKGRVVQPILDIPQNFQTLTAPKSTLVQRGIAGLGIVGALSPGFEDIGFGLYERQKARSVAQAKGLTPSQVTEAGRAGLAGETYTPAGEALRIKSPTISKTVSALEVPALLVAGGLKARGGKKITQGQLDAFGELGKAINLIEGIPERVKIKGMYRSGGEEAIKNDAAILKDLIVLGRELKLNKKWLQTAGRDQIFNAIGAVIRSSKDQNVPVGLQAKPIGGTKALQEAEKLSLQKGVGPQTGLVRGIAKQGEKLSQKTKVAELLPPAPGKQAGYLPTTSDIGGKDLSSGVILPQKGKLNVERLNLSGEQKQIVSTLQDKVPVTVIGNKEVVKRSALTRGAKTALSDQQMVDRMASQLNSRQAVVDLTKQYEILKKTNAGESQLTDLLGQIAEQSRVAQQERTFAGRLLQSGNIMANEMATPMQKIFALLDNAGIKPEKYLKDATKVNWENASDVVSFYRKYVPPKFGELLDEYRYSNMLSSPLTHIINTFSNVLQSAVVAPVEKTLMGAIDWAKSPFTKAERKYYATDGITYLRGYTKSLPAAWSKFRNVVSGKEVSLRPDLEYTPTGTKGLAKAYTAPLHALEAADQFFRTLVSGGEKEVLKRFDIPEAALAKASQKAADYRLFRQAFDPDGKLGQGHLLRTWDKYNKMVSYLRRLPGGKWIVPFLQTPTNILKQGVEYSPLGLATLPGAANKVEQLSKAIIGTTVFSGAYGLLNAAPFTWSEPTDPNGRAQFYSAGMQPYSIKLGNKWVSYSKLGPLSYPMAMAAALRYAEKSNPDANVLENVSQALGGTLTFFGDQSYVKELGDLMEELRSDRPDKLKRFIESEAGNVAEQLTPYRSFLGWLTRTIDPVYRKAENIPEKIMAGIPGLSTKVSPYYNVETGEVSKRPSPLLNAVSPLRVGEARPGKADIYEQLNIPLTGGSTERASAIWEKLKVIDKDEANAIGKRIKSENPSLFDQLKALSKEEKLGITPEEKKIKGLGVGSGYRTGAIAKKLKSLKTKEEQNALYKDYRRKGIITDEIAKQLKRMAQQGEFD